MVDDYYQILSWILSLGLVLTVAKSRANSQIYRGRLDRRLVNAEAKMVGWTLNYLGSLVPFLPAYIGRFSS
ncbi:hypothetical protein F5Y10DRAFT_238450 [Nemania abortiva]|nr:hypothetical protein F5Y10DRAFT_238450 [Nemania abortiva]